MFYVKLCDEQSAVYRQNVKEFKIQHVLCSQSADIARLGQDSSQDWELAPCNRDTFVTDEKEVPGAKIHWTIAEQVLRSGSGHFRADINGFQKKKRSQVFLFLCF